MTDYQTLNYLILMLASGVGIGTLVSVLFHWFTP